MKNIMRVPIDELLERFWSNIDIRLKWGFVSLLCINVLAFGFEMTNLTIHHDDVMQLFIQHDHFQLDLGRFGTAWLHYYTQGAFIMPFLQMVEGLIFMSLYGLGVAYFWGLRRPVDLVLVGSILCVFPYMAQVYQYNTSMATYSLAHLLSAFAVICATRKSLPLVACSSILFAASFSIYQSVVANAATIFILWLVSQINFENSVSKRQWVYLFKSSISVLGSVMVGGVVYIIVVKSLGVKLDDYQGASGAFSLEKHDLALGLAKIIEGTRAFYFWPENYFPEWSKKLQLLLILLAGFLCLTGPNKWQLKIMSSTLLGMALISPRLLQALHPEGWFHNLTLTAYAVTIAGAAMVTLRAGYVVVRNFSIILVSGLIYGYVVYCNWISTVNYLNTMAHQASVTQILARLRSIPDYSWDGKTIIVVGSYKMRTDFPYRRTTGVASDYMDARHMQRIAHLMRDEAIFISEDDAEPGFLSYAKGLPTWPDPKSVAVVDGKALIVLSKDQVE